MRLLAILLVPAFMGLVKSQQGQGIGHNFPEQGGSPQGGSSRGKGFGHAPVHTGMGNQHPVQNGGSNNVNMANAGKPPAAGGKSGQLVDYGYGAPAGGAANAGGHNAPVLNAGAGGSYGNPGGSYGNPGGSSRGGGNGGYNAGNFGGNAGNAPFGGAQHLEGAGNAGHVSSGAGAGTAVAGVVVAVLVLVGVVAVAAVFIVRRRRARMTIGAV